MCMCEGGVAVILNVLLDFYSMSEIVFVSQSEVCKMGLCPSCLNSFVITLSLKM